MKISEIGYANLPTLESIVDGKSYTVNPQGGLIAVPENVEKAMEAQPTDAMTKNTEQTNLSSLSEAEKSSIETDITAKKPIGDTPAYLKFLQRVFPDKEPTFPYLADYDDALMVVSQLTQLFGKSVRLPSKNEAIASLKNNNHLTGYRDADNGRIGRVGDIGYAWISGELFRENAPCIWLNRLDGSYSGRYDRRLGRSVIPIFG